MTNNYPRAFLWGALILALYLNFIYWQRDYPSVTSSPATATTPTGAASSHGLRSDVPTMTSEAPSVASSNAPSAAAGAASAAGAADTGVPSVSAGVVHVRTDVLDVDISLEGGTLVRVALPSYPKVKGGTEPVRLFNLDPDTLYVLESGLAGPAGAARPTAQAQFTSTGRDFALASGQNELHVPLSWTDSQGVTVTKDFVFHRGQYAIDLRQTVENHSTSPWRTEPYARLWRNDPPTKRSYFNVESYAFHGPALFDPNGTKYRKLKVTDADDARLAQHVKDGWVAALQHHFVAAIVPPAHDDYLYTMKVDGNQYSLRVNGPARDVPAGGSATFSLELFVGPKLQGQLETVSPELGRVADYGMLWLLARPLFLALQLADSVFGNWGVAIIFVTFLLKLLFYPLSEASGKSMAKMKALAPRVKQIQETYKDDREKSGRAMMELYQREKVNPVAGCLPMIVQLPVFLAFYWVLLESVEMRQAPFLGWINDLSSRDPLYILPLIMAGAMFVQYKMNPPAPDPVQAKVFMIMPLVMSVTFAFFPAGLVLYWITNTILTIAQQWNINRRIAAASAKRT